MHQAERLNHKDPAVAKSICGLLVLAHAQEAELLRAEITLVFDQTPEGIQSSAQVYFGAHRAGVLIGLVSVGPDDEPGQLRIVVLVVHPEHQRQGIARALVTFTLSQAVGTVFSVVAAANHDAAIHLYRSLGFTEYRRGTMGAGELEVVKLRTHPDASFNRACPGA